ncbi:MAG: hypothetical protein KDC54_05675, partial [Lewinella sp.]|nr:hypothetical protein [Lewinella sp.]
MKTPQDHLWQLIQRLSPAEKRYFRRHFGFAGNQLTQLYDLLNQQPAYDEDAARRTLDVPAAAYKVLKAQLMELLLKSLLAEEGKRPPSARLHLGLEEVRLLQQRHLFVEAERRLQRLHKWAERHQLTHELPLITEKIGWTGEPTTVQLSPHERAQRMQLCGQLWQYRTQWLNRAGDWDAPQWLAGMQAIDWPALSFPYQLLYWEWLGDYWRELDQPQSALQAYQQGLQPFIESPELAAAHPWAYLQLLRVNADYLSWQIPVPPQLYVITDLAEQHLSGFPELEPQRLHFLLAKMRALFLQQHWQAIIQRKETIILSHLERFQLETTSAGALVCLLLANTYLVLDNPSRVQYYMRRFQAASHLVEKPLRYTANIL